MTRPSLRVLLLLALGLAGCRGDDALSREQAADVVVSSLVDDGARVLVFSWPDVLDSSHTLAPYAYEGLPEPAAIPVESPSWFFWIDDEPGALFDHANRFVLVDRATGELTVHDARWWPVIDGAGAWIERDDYWNPEAWVHAPEGWDMTVIPRAQPVVPREGPICQPGYGTGIVINGWKPGQTGQDSFRGDGTNMTTALENMGIDTTYAGPTGEPGVEMPNTVDALDMYFAQKAMELQPGDNFVVFLTGHGGALDDGWGIVGGISETQLELWLARFKPGVNIVFLVNGCHSGALLDGLACVADLGLAATSSDKSSFGDLDYLVGLTQLNDTNPDDTGSEWTSSLLQGVSDILASPTEMMNLQNTAAATGTPFIRVLMARAFELARKYDITAINGWSMPTAQSGAAKTQPDPVPDPVPPVCEPDVPDPPTGCGNPAIDDPMAKFAELFLLDDTERAAACDAAQELPTGNSVQHSDGVKTSTAEGECDYKLGGSLRIELDPTWYGDHPCGSTGAVNVLCPPQSLPVDGPVRVFFSATDAPIPAASDTWNYQMSYVFDADGVAANNYVPSPQWPADFYADTDLWLQSTYTPSDGWSMSAVDAKDGGFAEVASGARLVFMDELFVLLVPEGELGAAASYRKTTFRHLGDYGQTMPWNGDVVPPVGDPLDPAQ